MNMRVQMTDEQLLAQRAARTGRPLPTNKTGDGNRGPGEALESRNPTDGMTPDVENMFDPTQFESGNAAPTSHTQNTTPSDLALLQQQLDAANGRNAPLQRQMEEMRASMAALQQSLAAKDTELATRLAAESSAKALKEAETFDPFEGMTADELSMIDPATLEAMRRSARQSVAKANAGRQDSAKMIADALAARDQQALQRYVRGAADTLGLVALGNDPKFQAFLREDDSAGVLLNGFVQSPDLDTAKALEKRVSTMIKRYEKSIPADSSKNNVDPQARLAAQLSRQGSGNGASGSQRKALTPEEAKGISAKAKMLIRNGKHKEANELLAQLS